MVLFSAFLVQAVPVATPLAGSTKMDRPVFQPRSNQLLVWIGFMNEPVPYSCLSISWFY